MSTPLRSIRHSTSRRRQFDVPIDVLQSGSRCSCGHSTGATQRDVGILGRIFGGAFQLTCSKPMLLRALAGTAS